MNRHVQPISPYLVTTVEEMQAGLNGAHVEQLALGSVAWNDWRNNHPEIWPNLMGADLRNYDLAGYDLHFASLQHANLSGANLSDAWLSSAHLEQADLRGANLTGAFAEWASFVAANLDKCTAIETDFTKANLEAVSAIEGHFSSARFHNSIMPGANFTESYLHQTDFTDAWMLSANLRNASLGQTSFINCNLTDTQGLDSCLHGSFSYIDFRTLEISGQLPLVFMRGCGLPESLIDYLPSLLGKAIEFYSCFISYSHDDKAFARRLYAQLQDRGIRCWLDERQVLPGDDLHEEIQDGIKLWDKVLLCCSKASLNSWWVDNEIEIAFSKERDLMKKRGRKVYSLIPLNLDGHLFNGEWSSGKREQIRSRLAGDFSGWETDNTKFEEQFERLVTALRSDDQGRDKPPTPKL